MVTENIPDRLILQNVDSEVCFESVWLQNLLRRWEGNSIFHNIMNSLKAARLNLTFAVASEADQDQTETEPNLKRGQIEAEQSLKRGRKEVEPRPNIGRT